MGTGYDVAERLHLINRLAREQIPFETLTYVNTAGKPIAKLETTLLRSITKGKYMGLIHWTLEEALYDAVAHRVEIRFGRSLTRVVQGRDGVSVTFNDGTTESFDLLIGTDGVHSHTSSSSDQKTSSVALWAIPLPAIPSPTVTASGTPGTCISNQDAWLPPIARHRQMKSSRFSCISQPRLSMFPVSSGSHAYEKCLQGWAGSPTSSSRRQSINAGVHGCGDSDSDAYLASGTGGSGGGCLRLSHAALRTGGVPGHGRSLSPGRALHETASYEEAFRRYEHQMYSYVRSQQKNARGFVRSFLPGTRFGLFVQQTMMKALFRERFRGLLRREFSAPSLSTLHPQNITSSDLAVVGMSSKRLHPLWKNILQAFV